MPNEKFRGLTLNELMAWKSPITKNIIEQNILPSQGILVIYGAEGIFKSIMAEDLAMRLPFGKTWFDFKTVPSSVYYFQSEIPQKLLQDRTAKYVRGNQVVSGKFWLATDLYTKIDKGWGSTTMEEELLRTRPDVLIIDPLNNSTSANLVNDYEVGQMIDTFNRWRQVFGCAIILIHHNRQEEAREGKTYHYGTDDIFGTRIKKWADTIIFVKQTADNDPMVDLHLAFEKTRHAESKIAPIDIQVDRRTLVFSRKHGKTTLNTNVPLHAITTDVDFIT